MVGCSRDAKDREKLEYVRELNRKKFAETGEYMTDVRLLRHCPANIALYVALAKLEDQYKPCYLQEEIAAIRTPRWTDRRCNDLLLEFSQCFTDHLL